MKSTRGARSGFTLIELLVVIAIIAILAAILFPVFAKAREKARQSSCQSNEKQILIGILQYVNDYDERFPSSWRGTAYAAATGYTWRLMIEPYMKSAQLQVCPSAANRNTWQPVGAYNATEWAGTSGYGANRVHWATGAPTDLMSGINLAEVQFPSETIAIGDHDAADTAAISLEFNHPQTFTNNNAGNQRHNDGSNYGYADGHVKWQNYRNQACTSIGGGNDNCPWSIE